MIKIKNVQGTQKIVQQIEVGVDTVYERSNIVKITEKNKETDEIMELWQYDETQYTLQEWLQILTNEVINLKTKNKY